MKKKTIVVLSVTIAVILLIPLAITCCATDFFRSEKFGNYIVFPDNVYDEIWNEMEVAHFGDTVLDSIGAASYVKVGIGGLDHISVDCGDRRAQLSWYGENRILICVSAVSQKDGRVGWYVYDCAANTLYGDTAEEPWLADGLLSGYFEAAGKSTDFSFDDRGDYTFVMVGSIFSDLPKE